MTTENNTELGRLSLIRSNNARRRRLLRKSTCPAQTHFTKRPAGAVSPAREDVSGGACESRAGVNPLGSASVIGRRREVEPGLMSIGEVPAPTQFPKRSAGDVSPAREDICGGACETRAGADPFGSASVIGRRREMEDTVRAELGFMNSSSGPVDYYGVFDGHGGAWVAEACGERLHRILASEGGGGGGTGWEEAMVRCFGKMDEEVAGAAAHGCASASAMKMVGSTAVVAVVGREVVVVANCGDSRAVLYSGGIALPLSSDHKPDRPDELERIEAAGGRVINWNGHRVLGVLNTSRSIGDQHLKPYVIPEPEVTISQRSPSDEFLILASDGLWDVVSNEVACQVVRRCLDGRIKRRSGEVACESRAAEAATMLADFAVARGSDDNVSVLVVKL